MTRKPLIGRTLVGLTLGAIFFAVPSVAAETGLSPPLCLRNDELAQITMAGDSAATVKDRSGRVFRVTFTEPCGARHVGVFFTTHSQNMQTCLKPGVPLPTNRSGACVVKSVHVED